MAILAHTRARTCPGTHPRTHTHTYTHTHARTHTRAALLAGTTPWRLLSTTWLIQGGTPSPCCCGGAACPKPPTFPLSVRARARLHAGHGCKKYGGSGVAVCVRMRAHHRSPAHAKSCAGLRAGHGCKCGR